LNLKNEIMSLRERYLELKQKAKNAMENGQLSQYLKLLIEVEELNLILVKVKK
jgi:hypothetical protein